MKHLHTAIVLLKHTICEPGCLKLILRQSSASRTHLHHHPTKAEGQMPAAINTAAPLV